MSVINSSHFALMRARKEMEKAFKHADWQEIKYWDTKLGKYLDDAFDDDNRDTKALIVELEKILSTYNKVVSNLANAPQSDWFIPEKQ